MGVVGVYNFDNNNQRARFINDLKEELPEDDHRKNLLDDFISAFDDVVEQSEDFEDTIFRLNGDIEDAEEDSNKLEDENDKLNQRVTELEEEMEKLKNA